jgi:cytochrome c-type protein NapB
MNGKLVTRLMLAVALVVYASQALAEESVESLRGITAIKANSATPEPKKWKGKSELIARDYVQQPPLIPHKSQSFKTNLKGNKCISCHGPADYEEAEATRISESHFKDRDGNLLADVSASRYFCTQCHVEQRDVAPLVDNEFKSAKIVD